MKATLRKRSLLQLHRTPNTGISHVIKFSHRITTLICLLGSPHVNPQEQKWMAFASSTSCPTDYLPCNSCTQTPSSGTICTCHWLRSPAISVTVSSVQMIFQCILRFPWWTILARESGPEGLQCTRSQKSSAPQLYFCGSEVHSNRELAWHVLKLMFTIPFHSFSFYIYFLETP